MGKQKNFHCVKCDTTHPRLIRRNCQRPAATQQEVFKDNSVTQFPASSGSQLGTTQDDAVSTVSFYKILLYWFTSYTSVYGTLVELFINQRKLLWSKTLQ